MSRWIDVYSEMSADDKVAALAYMDDVKVVFKQNVRPGQWSSHIENPPVDPDDPSAWAGWAIADSPTYEECFEITVAFIHYKLKELERDQLANRTGETHAQ